jgi:hypothetical protein
MLFTQANPKIFVCYVEATLQSIVTGYIARFSAQEEVSVFIMSRPTLPIHIRGYFHADKLARV